MSAGIIKTDISDQLQLFIVDNGSNLTAFPRKLTKAIRIITLREEILAGRKFGGFGGFCPKPPN